jgi:hypothetical protein
LKKVICPYPDWRDPHTGFARAPLFGPYQKRSGCIILIGTFSEGLIETYDLKVAGMVRQISSTLGADSEHIFRNGSIKLVDESFVEKGLRKTFSFY